MLFYIRSGVVSPADDEPEPPAEIPEEELPEIIEFGFGNFESNTTYTPGTYETVPYEITYTRKISSDISRCCVVEVECNKRL